MQTKRCFLILCCSLKFRKKKTQASSICKRFLFPEGNDPPKVTTPLKLRPPKDANSESNEGRYYRNSTVCIQLIWRRKVLYMQVYEDLYDASKFIESNQEWTHEPSLVLLICILPQN